MKQDILLESGINELEIVIFKAGNSVLGVNVAKVECILTHQPITDVPNSNKNISGVINYRGRVIPVLDLIKTLKQNCPKTSKERLLILININNSDFAVEVSSVSGIRRLSWKEIETPSSILLSQNETPITGIVKAENDEIILMLDFEKILGDIDPSLALKESSATKGLEGKKLVVAEDSTFLLKVVNESLLKAGATVEKFGNGQDALTFLENSSLDEIYCVITDIEMPVMDGLTLTKQIKSNSRLKQIPVILFSSIASEGLAHKGLSVGADAQITKPEIDKLVEMVINIRK
ncbi:chemotaxis protein CheV [Desulfosporosinus lacus]|uniref:Stage 0 sporulation protein A homolog n=1 Tax=Desulfosporosinus lacus DSM 15449 TaxID=1121420 RepID=A0A1M5VJE2_9FIRM|nr:chemotaxis protein [Desulfosporosinus lacus]MDA8228495.1 chemotaxis protein [Desulfitobacterium hafniense]SHH75351.1 two-component system, chemotaxis family, response regulator CheV [Desulfosporosinus lacus DSM 15449]